MHSSSGDATRGFPFQECPNVPCLYFVDLMVYIRKSSCNLDLWDFFLRSLIHTFERNAKGEP